MLENFLATCENWLGKIMWIAVGVVLVLLVVIVFRNLEQTDVELIFGTVSMPLAALLSVTLLIGFVLGIVVTAFWGVKHRRGKSRTAKRVREPKSSTKNGS